MRDFHEVHPNFGLMARRSPGPTSPSPASSGPSRRPLSRGCRRPRSKTSGGWRCSATRPIRRRWPRSARPAPPRLACSAREPRPSTTVAGVNGTESAATYGNADSTEEGEVEPPIARDPSAPATDTVDAWRVFGLDPSIGCSPRPALYWPDADVELRLWSESEQIAGCVFENHPAPAEDARVASAACRTATASSLSCNATTSSPTPASLARWRWTVGCCRATPSTPRRRSGPSAAAVNAPSAFAARPKPGHAYRNSMATCLIPVSGVFPGFSTAETCSRNDRPSDSVPEAVIWIWAAFRPG